MSENKSQYMWPATWKKPYVYGSEGAVSCNNVYATRAGLEILYQGGNAFDAAAAVSLALAVVEPHHSGIGGGCFSLLYSASTQKIEALDARGIAPKNADNDLFLQNGEVQDEWKDVSGKSVAIPGLYKAIDTILKKYGTMGLKQVSEPAIRYAKNGFGVSFTGSITSDDDSVHRKCSLSKDFCHLYLKADGSSYQFGEQMKNPELGNLLEAISSGGVEKFYTGTIAKKIVDAINARGGIFTLEDLAEYSPKFRTPIHTSYRGYEVVAFAPPSGGCALLEMLNILENYDLKNMGHNSAQSIHTIAEAMKLGFADRSVAMGDPDFVKVNTEHILSKEYAAKRSSHIDADHAKEFAPASGIGVKDYPGNTSHFVVMDRDGNTVSQTQTVRDWFGCGIVVPGCGFILNNAMSDFSAKEGTLTSQGLTYGNANCIKGGKTPLSSMSPTIVFKDRKPFLAIGAAGGPRIITGTLQGILNAVDFGMMPEQLVRMPFITCLTKAQGLELESGISEDTRNLLKAKDHKIVAVPKGLALSSMLNCVMYRDGQFYPCATERVDGCGGALMPDGHILLDGICQEELGK